MSDKLKNILSLFGLFVLLLADVVGFYVLVRAGALIWVLVYALAGLMVIRLLIPLGSGD